MNIARFLCFSLLLVLAGCKSETGIPGQDEQPELWLDLRINMEKDSAMALLGSMARSGEIGPSKTFLPYEFETDEYQYPAELSFKPLFEKGKLKGAEYQLAYIGWAPWNRDRWADKLMLEHIMVMADRYDISLNATTGKRGMSAFEGSNEQSGLKLKVWQHDDQYIKGTISEEQ